MGTAKGLTPIKVPGKNTRDRRHREKLKTSRPPGRPMKSFRDLKSKSRSSTPATTAGDKKKSTKQRSLIHIKSRRKMSRLELLPAELLQRIFLIDLDLSLPRASPIIAGKLSSEYVYNQCLLRTFGPYWHNLIRDKQLYTISDLLDPASEIDEPSGEQQSALVRCRWFNVERIRKVETQWAAQMQEYLIKNHITLLKLEMPDRHQAVTDDHFDEDWSFFRVALPDMEFYNWSDWGIKSGDENGYLDAERQGLLTFRKDFVEIPGGLVNGNWTEDKVKLLFYLWRAGARIEKKYSTAGEEAQAGLADAIITGNLCAVYLLYKLKIYIPFTTPLILQYLENSITAPKDSEFSENFDAFISFFASCLRCKWYEFKEDTENIELVSRRRRAEVEREVLDLRRQAKGEMDKKRKSILEWEARVLEVIYNLINHKRVDGWTVALRFENFGAGA